MQIKNYNFDKSELEMSAYIKHSSIELWGHFGNINEANNYLIQ